MKDINIALASLVVLLTAQISTASSDVSKKAIDRFRDKVDHIIVFYQENWSFDGLYGEFPGANGIANARGTTRQVDRDGHPYLTLPAPLIDGKIDTRFPGGLPLEPFDLATYVAPTGHTGDLLHRFYQEQFEIDGGRMDRFIAWSGAGGLVLSYYDATSMPEGILAKKYTLCDNFFHAAFGGSFLNHMWLIAAATPQFPDAPQDLMCHFDRNGNWINEQDDPALTSDGYAVNTIFSSFSPHPAGIAKEHLLPPLTLATIGDRLREKDVSWAWYSGGWNDALAGHPAKNFQFHHQPFAYFAQYGDGTKDRATHLKDESDFLDGVNRGELPSVCFVKALGDFNEHPGYASVASGQQHVIDLVHAVQKSKLWDRTLMIITYDEHGGRWDHVPPPVVDRWGPGTRVPTIVISRYARKHFVDHTQYDTTSILKLIEDRWDLRPLSTRDANQNSLLNATLFVSDDTE